jgi:hypothetical protein
MAVLPADYTGKSPVLQPLPGVCAGDGGKKFPEGEKLCLHFNIQSANIAGIWMARPLWTGP